MDQIRQADAERILTEVRSVRADIMNKVSEVQAAVGHAQMDVVREVQQAASDANDTDDRTTTSDATDRRVRDPSRR